jgi:hypothetical protein
MLTNDQSVSQSAKETADAVKLIGTFMQHFATNVPKGDIRGCWHHNLNKISSPRDKRQLLTQVGAVTVLSACRNKHTWLQGHILFHSKRWRGLADEWSVIRSEGNVCQEEGGSSSGEGKMNSCWWRECRIKGKVKFALEQAMKTQYISTLSLTSALDRESRQSHAPTA